MRSYVRNNNTEVVFGDKRAMYASRSCFEARVEQWRGRRKIANGGGEGTKREQLLGGIARNSLLHRKKLQVAFSRAQ